MNKRKDFPLLPRHKKLLDFIRAYHAEREYMPTLEEMAVEIGTSRGRIWSMLEILRECEYIDRRPGQHRAIRLL